MAAARAAMNPGFPLAVLAAELRDMRGGLDALRSEEPAADVRTIFSWSYRALNAEAATLFRRLAVHPGPDFAVPAAASLAGIPLARARDLLAELTRAHLVAERAPGRYTVHDLLRAYATELIRTVESDAEQRSALRRLLDHYLHSAHNAAVVLRPNRAPLSLEPPVVSVEVVSPASHNQALAWFSAEYSVLLAVSALADQSGLNVHVWQLAWTMMDFCRRQGHWSSWAVTHEAALAAAQRIREPTGRAHIHRGLAGAYTHLGRYDDAYAHLQAALLCWEAIGDQTQQAVTHFDLSCLLSRQGSHADALVHAQCALNLYRATGHAAGEAGCLNGVGWLHARLGNHEVGLSYCRQALVLLLQLGDRAVQADTWDSLGYIHHHLGQAAPAEICYNQALELYRHLADREGEAKVLIRVGDCRDASDDPIGAREAWERALAVLNGLEHSAADRVRTRLRRLRNGKESAPVPVGEAPELITPAAVAGV